jgi:hypothetical protein
MNSSNGITADENGRLFAISGQSLMEIDPAFWLDLGNFSDAGDGMAVFTDPDPFRVQGPNGYYRAFLRPLPQQ